MPVRNGANGFHGDRILSNRDYFCEQLELEDAMMPQVLQWLEKDFEFKLKEDLRKKPEWWGADVDLLAAHEILGDVKIEVKIRKRYYPDLAIETLSVRERLVLGWIYTCKADYLAYVYVENDKLCKDRYVLHMKTLREWFDRNKQRFTHKEAPNPKVGKPEYHTEFYIIPINEIPKHIFLPELVRQKNKFTGKVSHGSQRC